MSVWTHFSRYSRRPLLTSWHRYPSVFEQFFRFSCAWNTFIYSNKEHSRWKKRKNIELRHNVDKQPRSTNGKEKYICVKYSMNFQAKHSRSQKVFLLWAAFTGTYFHFPQPMNCKMTEAELIISSIYMSVGIYRGWDGNHFLGVFLITRRISFSVVFLITTLYFSLLLHIKNLDFEYCFSSL